ncbi:MAG: hypothetical protein LBH06_07810, partial [Rikenellaceae bacterium]|nr:hypothetical protein [Rikenellaceae bacterium]
PLATLLVLLLAISLGATALRGQTAGGKKIVDFTADIMKSIHLGDTTAMCLVGNVIFYHNGAIITCDSAIRYGERRMECFRNVVINKETFYAYGDRADYNGASNIARIYSPLIKMVDKDATMYSYDFAFNTKTNLGYYATTATLKQKESQVESRRGYYNTKTRELVGAGAVEIRNPDYRIKSDSVNYNLDSEVTTFYSRTNIWNSKGEILSADRGWHDSKASRYFFTSDAYILTDRQEVWADSIDYHSDSENGVLRRNVQILDDGQKSLAFGDRALYWGERQHAILTRNPSLISFDPMEDSLFMRGDSILLYTMDKDKAMRQDSLARSLTAGGAQDEEEELVVTKPAVMADSLATDSLAVDKVEKAPEVRERKGFFAWLKGLFKKKERQPKAVAEAAPPVKSDSAAVSSLPDSLAVLAPLPDTLAVFLDSLAVVAPPDSLANDETVRILDEATKKLDQYEAQLSRPETVPDDEAAEGQGPELPAAPKPWRIEDETPSTHNADSLVRTVKAYFNVKIYRTDFQSVCDSLISFSLDSTIHMYKDPVLWNGSNQIVARVIDVTTQNQKISRALFTGDPIMSSQVDSLGVDTVHYNQVKGKVIESFLRDNEVYRTDVNGNGQTYYYMTDDETGDMQGFLVAECGNITFNMAERQISTIVYKADPVYTIYPMDRIPEDQPLKLPDFKWEGHRRPSQREVFDRTVRPSQREAYTALPEPMFPITLQIMDNRTRMIQSGAWRDRNDRVNQDTYDFIRSLGY